MIGFVYIWFDRHRKMYYIGSHKGSETDGYIGSNRWFNNAYKKRPKDFKRRIIARQYEGDRKQLYGLELRWLIMIKPEELEVSYYNKKKASMGFDSLTASRVVKLTNARVHSVKNEEGKSIHAVKMGNAGGRPGGLASTFIKNEEGKSIHAIKMGKASMAKMDKEQRKALAILGGRAGGRKGGLASVGSKTKEQRSFWAETMNKLRTAEERKELARKAGRASANARTPEQKREFGRRAGLPGSKYINNGIINKRLKADALLPVGWTYGYLTPAYS